MSLGDEVRARRSLLAAQNAKPPIVTLAEQRAQRVNAMPAYSTLANEFVAEAQALGSQPTSSVVIGERLGMFPVRKSVWLLRQPKPGIGGDTYAQQGVAIGTDGRIFFNERGGTLSTIWAAMPYATGTVPLQELRSLMVQYLAH